MKSLPSIKSFITGKNSNFITLKNHKPNFQNNPKVRLLNSTKNELGQISILVYFIIKSDQPRLTRKKNAWNMSLLLTLNIFHTLL